MVTWCTYTKSQMPYLNITLFWCCGNFLNLTQQILHVDFVEPIKWFRFIPFLQLVHAIIKACASQFFYKQIFRRKVGLIYFLTSFWLPLIGLVWVIPSIISPTLGYYRGDNPHQTDFDPKFTGGFVTRLTCFKSPIVLQVKILENTVITIRSARLFLWKWPKVGWGQPNDS